MPTEAESISELTDGIAELVVTSIKSATAPLLARIAALEARQAVPGRDGLNGRDGKDGKDGRDGTNGIDGKDGLNGKDGRDGVDGKNGHDGTHGLNGKDGAPGVNGKDGLNGKDGRDGVDGKDGLNFGLVDVIADRFDPDTKVLTVTVAQGDVRRELQIGSAILPSYREVYTEGKSYVPGDTVTWGGSLWIALEATTAKPGLPTPQSRAWRLAVKHGRDGKAGPKGDPGERGPKGDTGDRGPKGY